MVTNPRRLAAFFLLLAPLAGLHAADGEILSLNYDGAMAGPGRFAVEEIQREVSARGLKVVVNDAKASDDALRITFALDAPAKGELVPQSYDIAVQNENGRRTITVRGADVWRTGHRGGDSHWHFESLEGLPPCAAYRAAGHQAEQTPSLPDARPRSDRFRCGGRESIFLAVIPPPTALRCPRVGKKQILSISYEYPF